MPAGRPKGSTGGKHKMMSEALILALNREAENAKGKRTKRLTVIADQLVEKAMEGDVQAIREVFDRVEGKPAQKQVLVGSDEDDAIKFAQIVFKPVSNASSKKD